ncbi:MAG: hypothetical protein WC693_02615 [Patescibacteria group bacterium]|jgi:hypothetical protein
MEENINPAHKKGNNIGLIVLISVVIFLIAGALWYAFGKENENTNNANTTQVGNENTNTVLNTNANTNTAVNSNTNSAVDTSDWLTYTNEEYGFEFKYPRDFSVTDNASYFSVLPINNNEALPRAVDISQGSITDHINSIIDSDSLNEVLSNESLEINGEDVNQLILKTAIGLDYVYTTFQKDNYLIDLITIKDDEIGEQIIDSFILL